MYTFFRYTTGLVEKKTRETVITLNGTMDGIIIVSLTANDTNITLAKLE